MRFSLRAGKRRCAVKLDYLGRHNVSNAAGAAALALALGVSLAAIRRGLEKARPFAMRMETARWRGARVINDAYNANPASMTAAVDTLAAVNGGGEKVAVLGDMFELGRDERARAPRAWQAGRKDALQRLYLLGRQAAAVRAGALSAGMDASKVIVGKDHSDIARQLKSHVRKGDWLLIKGSRGMQMEKILRELKGQRDG